MGLNRLLGFKGPTHLIPSQIHPFDTLTKAQWIIFVKKLFQVQKKLKYIWNQKWNVKKNPLGSSPDIYKIIQGIN